MTEQSAFSKKRVETINIEKRDWMEELNLPPKLIVFLRENGQKLQIAAACLVALLLAWNGYEYYAANQRENATAMLASAMKEEQTEAKSGKLGKVISEYGSADAAVWAHLELAHLAYNAGQYGDAINHYKAADRDIGSGSSIKPFVHYGLAYSYEKNNEADQALAHYSKLANFAGYEREAYLGVARVNEAKNDAPAALAAYRKAAELKAGEGDAAAGDWINEKIEHLAAAENKSKQ